MPSHCSGARTGDVPQDSGLSTLTVDTASVYRHAYGRSGQMRYVAKCARPCTFLAWGEKPLDILYADPKDDPRKQTRK